MTKKEFEDHVIESCVNSLRYISASWLGKEMPPWPIKKEIQFQLVIIYHILEPLMPLCKKRLSKVDLELITIARNVTAAFVLQSENKTFIDETTSVH